MSHVIPSLGRLESVPLKEVWTSEPYAFDPWLMQPENLQFLADGLGLPGLELVQAQQPVGPFAADLVCRIIDTDNIVLIENQLDQADHRHLGQVLTYAPHVDAKLCVWVAEKIRDEHRAAVDWLNRITGEGYAFFGVEVRAVRIGNSVPAPLFEVVAKPNDWSKIITPSQPSIALSDSVASNIAYWRGFHQLLVDMNGPLRRAASDLKDVTYWAPIANSGRAYIWAYRSHGSKPYVVAGLSLYNAGAAEIWRTLDQERTEYDNAFGEPLKWHFNKKETAFHIQSDPRSSALEEADWPEQHRWLADRMVRFEAIFAARVKELIQAFDVGNLVAAGSSGSPMVA
jgi:hypothetical protein